MIIVLKQNAPEVQVREFCHELQDMGLQINDSKGSESHILGLIGDTKAVAESWVLANPVVETCRRVTEPYKKANRKFHPDDSVIDVDGVKIGGGNFAVIAGPCSIESEEQITYCAQRVKAAGASLLRGGAFKPRTSPYSFQGMRSEGLDLLKLARRATGAPIVTEIMNTEHLPLFENVDLIQVGARNMQNFELLKAVGRQKKPVLLKRGLANTLEEFVMSAEYIMAEGNENVILCERGIRTFETSMRNTLDLAGVVMLHKMTHLPVIVDPSHACGHAWMVPQLAKAAVAAGADGLMIEVHNDPAKAKCDGAPKEKSGTMSTVGHAERYGKPVFAVPGSIFSPASAGTNALLRDGRAKAVCTAADLFGTLGLQAARPAPAPRETPRSLSENERLVLSCLGAKAQGVEELGVKSGLPTAALLGVLMKLELAGRVSCLPGKRYILRGGSAS